MGKIYAFVNQKGGVGKTTTAVNLGAYLAWQGRRVLLIDLDPQGNASASLGVDRHALPLSMYDVLLGDQRLDEIHLPAALENLMLAPSAPTLAGSEVELTDAPEREFILRRALTDPPAVRDQFDHILIDCPPSLGILTVNALTAADFVVVPVQCEYLALEGLALLTQTIDLVRENLNPDLQLFGLVMTMHDSRARLASQVIEQVRSHFPNEVFDTYIPRNVRVAEAPSFGEPLVKFDIHSRGAQAYESLTNEFLLREAIRVTGSTFDVLLPSTKNLLAAPETSSSSIGYLPSTISDSRSQMS
ncbi:MAG TPA: ParA family protein [Anaerolineae bacterium]|nr:ParA family protein [Anaerolineae bacterium]